MVSPAEMKHVAVTAGGPNAWAQMAEEIGPALAEGAAGHDREGKFVAEHYAELKRRKFFSAQVPAELGGGGATHSQICEALRVMARFDGSTALANAMHQHLISAMVWKWRHGGSDAVLKKVAAGELVLVSTGANDWLESNGRMERADGGYRVTARKPFASGSPAADIAVTSAPYNDPAKGEVVLHFGVPLKQEGVRLADDWDTLGMRGTGSGTLVFENVFVPESAIALERPRGKFHPFWGVVLAVAMPPIMSVYLGIAERARDVAVELMKKEAGEIGYQLVGELETELAVCRLATEDAVRLANDGAFEPSERLASDVVQRKSIASRAAVATVEKSMECVGGRAFYRSCEIERLLRDVHAAQYHPLQEKWQRRFSGRVAMGLGGIG